MAFKTTTSLAVEYERLKAFARHLRAQAVRHKTTTSFPTLVDELLPLMREASERFGSVPAGVADFAKAQESDETYDVVAAFTAMSVAAEDVLALLVSGVPTDAEGYVLDRQMDEQGVVTARVLTAPETAALNAKLDAVIATIEA